MFEQNDLLDLVDIGIIILDTDLKITFWNKWIEEKTTISKTQALNIPLTKVLKNRVSKKLLTSIEASLKMGLSTVLSDRFNKYAIEIYKDNDPEKLIETKCKITRIRNTEGKINCLLQIIDVTLSNKREQYLIDQNKLIEDKTKEIDLQNKMASLGRMASGIVHEINNPVAVIKGFEITYEMMKKNKTLDSEKIDNMFSRIQAMADRISHIIKGLKIIAHRDTYQFDKKFPLYEIISEAIDLSKIKIESSNILVEIDDIPKNYEVYCDSIQISQIIINLISNATDAIEEIPNPWIYINVRPIDKYYEVRVVDCGSGIPPEAADQIFDPFYTSKKVGKGTGLGLSISLKIAEAHRGTLSIDKTATNTTFILKLPQSDHWIE